MGCETELLKEVNRAKALEFICDNDEPSWVRFWSETSVQIDGDVTVPYMKKLVALMESFE